MNQITEMLLTIAMGVIGVTILAVIVSRNSNTAGVIQASASGFGNVLGVATAPVTGNKYTIDLSYPGAGGIGNLNGGFVNAYG